MTKEMTGSNSGLPPTGARYPLISVLLLLVLSIAATIGISRLKTDAGFESLFYEDASSRQNYLNTTREFGSDNRVFIYMREEGLWSPAKLKTLEVLHEELLQLPFVERIDDLFTHPVARLQDEQLFAQPILQTAPDDELPAENAKHIALSNWPQTKHLSSSDGLSLAISVYLKENDGQFDENLVHQALEATLIKARKELPSITQTGSLENQIGIRKSSAFDIKLIGILSFSALCLVSLMLSGSYQGAILSASSSLLSFFWAIGLGGLMGIPFNSLLFLALLPLLITTHNLQNHTWKWAHPQEGKAKRRDMAWALAALVLIAGFTTQAFSGIPAVRQFSILVLITILCQLVAAPLLCGLFDRFFPKTPGSAETKTIPKALAKAVRLLMILLRSQLGASALGILAVGSLGLLLYASSRPMAHDPLTFLPKSASSIKVADRMHEELAGINLFYMTLEANADDAFRSPENLQRLSDIQAFLSNQDVFDQSLSIADLVSQANKEATGGRVGTYQIPSSRKLVNQYLLLYRSKDLAPYVSHDFRRATIIVRHNERDAATLDRQINELRPSIARYAGSSMTTYITGQGTLIAAAGEQLSKYQIISLSIIIATICIAMALTFTSVKGGLIAATLCCISLLITFGFIEALGFPMSMLTTPLMISLSAISVWGTSRIFTRYIELSQGTNQSKEASSLAARNEAPVIITLGLCFSLAFIPLTMSGLEPLKQLGIIGCIAVITPCLANLLIAPLALAHLPLVGLYEILAMSTQREALEKSPLFAGLNYYQIRKSILISEIREFPIHDCIIKQGTTGRNMYLVLKGSLEVIRHYETGDQRLAVLKSGDIFGEIGFVNDTYRTADVCALEDVTVLCIDHDKLKRNLLLFPHIMAKLNFNISGILGKRLAEFVEKGQTAKK